MRINIKKILICLSAVVVLFMAQCGLVLDEVDIPDHGVVNELAKFVMHCAIEPRIDEGGDNPYYTTKLIIGFLAPKSWDAAKNTTVSFTSPIGSSSMSVISSELEPNTGLPWSRACKEKLGVGGNLVTDGMEWVVFESRDAYTVYNNEDFDFDVVIKSKCGSGNMLAKLGFYYGVSKESLNGNSDYTKTFFTDCFSVTGGEGPVVDYCHPQFSTISPFNSLDNDIITLKFNNGIQQTELSNTDSIYLQIKAFTSNGDSIIVDEKSQKTKLTAIGGEKYRLDIWPRGFFKVTTDQHITKLEYYFTNRKGTKKLGSDNTSKPFEYVFSCP